MCSSLDTKPKRIEWKIEKTREVWSYHRDVSNILEGGKEMPVRELKTDDGAGCLHTGIFGKDRVTSRDQNISVIFDIERHGIDE